MVKLQFGELKKIETLKQFIELGLPNSEIMSAMHISYGELARLKKKLNELKEMYEAQE